VAVLLLALAESPATASTAPFESALALYNARQFSAARVLFAAAARAEPGNVEVEFYLGRIALWFDQSDDALRHLEAAAARNPNDARIFNSLGDSYGLRAQDAALVLKPHWACKCREAYVRAVELAPNVVRYRWSLLGYCLLAPPLVGGGLDHAREQAAEIARRDDLQGRIARATIALQSHDAASAFAEFDSVLQREPDNFLALYHIGRCAAVSGEQLARGRAALERCLTLNLPSGLDVPTAANIHQRLGDILTHQGDAAGAAAEYARVRALEPDFRPQKLMLRF
jgi:tetratricopeptide (TPR) repeat protein